MSPVSCLRASLHWVEGTASRRDGKQASYQRILGSSQMGTGISLVPGVPHSLWPLGAWRARLHVTASCGFTVSAVGFGFYTPSPRPLQPTWQLVPWPGVQSGPRTQAEALQSPAASNEPVVWARHTASLLHYTWVLNIASLKVVILWKINRRFRILLTYVHPTVLHLCTSTFSGCSGFRACASVWPTTEEAQTGGAAGRVPCAMRAGAMSHVGD